MRTLTLPLVLAAALARGQQCEDPIAALAEERQKCLDAGMDAFLSKPLRLEGLHEALERAFEAEPALAVG